MKIKSDQELKDEMVEEMLNDIVNVEACISSTVQIRELICDDLIRHGWRKHHD